MQHEEKHQEEETLEIEEKIKKEGGTKRAEGEAEIREQLRKHDAEKLLGMIKSAGKLNPNAPIRVKMKMDILNFLDLGGNRS